MLAQQEGESRKDADLANLRQQIAAKNGTIERLSEQNKQLKTELEELKAQVKIQDEEMEMWRKPLRSMINGP